MFRDVMSPLLNFQSRIDAVKIINVKFKVCNNFVTNFSQKIIFSNIPLQFCIQLPNIFFPTNFVIQISTVVIDQSLFIQIFIFSFSILTIILLLVQQFLNIYVYLFYIALIILPYFMF